MNEDGTDAKGLTLPVTFEGYSLPSLQPHWPRPDSVPRSFAGLRATSASGLKASSKGPTSGDHITGRYIETGVEFVLLG